MPKATTNEAVATKTATKAEKTKATKPAKKAAPKADAESTGEYGLARSNDLPWCDKKVAVFKALKGLKAFSADSAKSATQLAERAGLTSRDVRHYAYHAGASGHIAVAQVEGIRGYGFYLTKDGQSVDPDKAYKAQEAAKGQKKEKATAE